MRSLILSSFFKPATDNFLNRFSDSRSSPHSHLRLRLARARIIYSRDCSEEGPGTGCYWWGVRYFDLNLNPCALCFIKRSLLKDMVDLNSGIAPFCMADSWQTAWGPTLASRPHCEGCWVQACCFSLMLSPWFWVTLLGLSHWAVSGPPFLPSPCVFWSYVTPRECVLVSQGLALVFGFQLFGSYIL